jgi:hypothetical protein
MLPPHDVDLPVPPPAGVESGGASGSEEGSGLSGDESGKNSFALSCGEPRVRLKRGQLDRWSAVYGTEHRQLRRWVKQGEASGDNCPLDDPIQMPAWWARNMRYQVPGKILAAAKACDPPPESSPVVEAPAKGLGEMEPGAVDLGGLVVAEGDEVRQAERLVQAAYGLLVEAYAGRGGEVDLLQRRWEKAQDALRKAKIQQEELLKRRRELISRAAVQRDHDTACELLRQMRGSMVRQILELCPLLDPPARAQVTSAIESVREKEERVFRNLDSMKQPSDVLQLLAS